MKRGAIVIVGPKFYGEVGHNLAVRKLIKFAAAIDEYKAKPACNDYYEE